jgi:hypothetical protein
MFAMSSFKAVPCPQSAARTIRDIKKNRNIQKELNNDTKKNIDIKKTLVGVVNDVLLWRECLLYEADITRCDVYVCAKLTAEEDEDGYEEDYNQEREVKGVLLYRFLKEENKNEEEEEEEEEKEERFRVIDELNDRSKEIAAIAVYNKHWFELGERRLSCEFWGEQRLQLHRLNDEYIRSRKGMREK